MTADQILKRHFWAVLASMTGASAFFGAQGVVGLVGAKLGVDERQLSTPRAVGASTAPGASASHSISAAAILSRNPFDSQAGSLNPVEPPPGSSPGGAPVPEQPPDYSNPFGAPPCDGVKVLVITASADPDWSFAAFSSGGDGAKTMLRRRGGDVNGKKVAFVGWDRVWLLAGNQLCQTQMFKPANAPPPPVAAPAAPAPTPVGGTGVPPDIAKGIQRVSATEFNVDRGAVDKILENQADLMRTARIVPDQENGKMLGIRLFGVRQDTLLGALGMENGDRLQTINGFEMANPEKALEAYARLRTADHLTITVNRRGQNVNLDYNIK